MFFFGGGYRREGGFLFVQFPGGRILAVVHKGIFSDNNCRAGKDGTGRGQTWPENGG